MQPATIKLFLTSGSATGLRTAELSNWNGKAVAGPRSELQALIQRTELDACGIYLLSNSLVDEQNMLYIGESENVAKRLRQQTRKEFWTFAVVFVSPTLTKAHVKYLEGKLIDKAKLLGLNIDNSEGSGARLPESERGG